MISVPGLESLVNVVVSKKGKTPERMEAAGMKHRKSEANRISGNIRELQRIPTRGDAWIYYNLHGSSFKY